MFCQFLLYSSPSSLFVSLLSVSVPFEGGGLPLSRCPSVSHTPPSHYTPTLSFPQTTELWGDLLAWREVQMKSPKSWLGSEPWTKW